MKRRRSRSDPQVQGDNTIEFLVPDEEHARVAQHQREYINSLADRLQKNEALSELDREWAAGILRSFAKQIPDRQRRKSGQAPRIDAGNLAIQYACMVHGQGMKPSAAKAKLSEEHCVTIETVRKAIKKYGDTALRWIPKNPNQKK